MTQDTERYALTFFIALGGVVTIAFGLTFWRLNHHSAGATSRWLLVWLWTMGAPAFQVCRVSRRGGCAGGSDTPLTARDAMRRLAWQSLMAGCLAALGTLSLLDEYVQR